MIDFDAAWRHLQQTTKAPDDCQRWNKKAARYDSRDAKNLYTEAFVELGRRATWRNNIRHGLRNGQRSLQKMADTRP